MKYLVEKGLNLKAGIYKITTTTSDNFYIGSTANSFYYRYHQHLYDLKNKKHHNRHLQRIFNKHGEESLIFNVLEVCDPVRCIEKEQYWIDSLNPFFNHLKVAGSLLGYKHPETAKTRTIKGDNHHCSRAVIQYSIDGVFIKEFGSIRSALSSLSKPIGSSTHVSECCKGIIFSCFGYRWALKGQDLIDRPRRLGKSPIFLEKNGVVLEFESQLSASNYIRSLGYKCNQGRISRSCKLPKQLVYGFKIINN